MVKWIEVKDIYENKVVLNVANFQGYRRIEQYNYFEYIHFCGNENYTVSEETHEKIMEAIDEYCDEFEKLVGKNEGSNEGSKEVVVQNTNGLDGRDIRYKILNADFLDAEQKLKLIVSLGV